MHDDEEVGKATALVSSGIPVILLLQHGASKPFDPNTTYMITGGLGGHGRAIAVWLAERGAFYLLFLSPSAGLKPNNLQLFMRAWDAPRLLCKEPYRRSRRS